MSEQNRLLKNTGIIAFGNISTKLVSFLFLPLYTALLSREEYGTFDYVVAVGTFVFPFITLLMDESMFRFLIDCETEVEKRKYVSQSIVIILCGSILFLLCSFVVFSIWEYRYAAQLILYILSFSCCSVINPLLRGLGNMKGYALYNFTLGTMTIILNVITIAWLKMGLSGLFVATIVSRFVVSALFGLYVKIWRYTDFSLCSWKSIKSMIIYSIPLIPNKISWSIINLSDRIVILHLISDSAAGLYAVAHKFPNLMDTIYDFFYQSWKESSARVLGHAEMSEFYNEVYTYVKRIMFSIVLCMISMMPIVFLILVNQSFSEAYLYVPVLLIATYFSNISGFYGGIFTAYKDTKIMGTTTTVAAVINLAIHIILLRFIGLYAAAISTLVANFVVTVYRDHAVKKYIVLNESTRDYVFSFCVLLSVLLLYYSQSVMNKLVGILVAVVFSIYLNKDVLLTVAGHLKKDKAA